MLLSSSLTAFGYEYVTTLFVAVVAVAVAAAPSVTILSVFFFYAFTPSSLYARTRTQVQNVRGVSPQYRPIYLIFVDAAVDLSPVDYSY